MQDFLYRCELHLIGGVGIYVLLIPISLITSFLYFSLECSRGVWCSLSTFLRIPAVILMVVLFYFLWKFSKGIEALHSYYTDTEGRLRCRKCKKIVYSDGESAHGATEFATYQGTYLRAYYENRCGNWHLSSQAPRQSLWPW